MSHKIFGRWTVSDARWKFFILGFILLYGLTINQFLHLRPDHMFLAMAIFAFGFLGKERGKLFLIDWFPFVLFWILYDMMRGVADSIKGGYVNVVEPYRLEALCFGWMTGHDIPAIWFAGWRVANEGRWYKEILDLMSANMYTLHFAAPLILMWIFWHTTDDRRSFYLFIYTITVLNISALATFMIYPAAPPWYVDKYGFQQPGIVGMVSGAVGGLLAVDNMLKVKFFTTLWDNFNANHFAAIPSLHGAYPLAIAFFIWKKFRGKTWLWFIYPLLTWFAAVYLNQHYIVDLIIGAGYLAAAYMLTDRILLPKVFDRYVDYQRTIRALGRERQVDDTVASEQKPGT